MMGRPPKYKPEFVQVALKMCEMGATDQDLADAFDVSVRTIDRWKVTHADFCQALKSSKANVDDNVERSLYLRAIGYSHEDVDIRVVDKILVETPIIKHYPPDVKACLAWLYNRRSDKWHPAPDMKDGDKETPPMELHFHVKEPVGDIKVTKGKPG